MSTSRSQEEAEAFLVDLDLNNGDIHKAGYQWQSIDYKEVSTETCEAILSLTGGKTNVRGYAPVIPETPRHQQIGRHVDAVLAERQYFVKQRVFAAQNLDECLRKDLEPVFNFLRAARRSPDEHIIFPDTERRILVSLDAVRATLAKVEDMVIGNSDLDATSPDSEAGDMTKVDFKAED
ncbi:hypothetical protein B0H13DRAFT_1877593 [Mycena leptocephala]|nr:hypothetical protein B0H13DRAFT_1877593 [Mycena leptocephala]